MKYLSKIGLFILLAAGFAACDKIDTLPTYGTGTATTLSISASSVAPPASDSLKPVVTLSWTNPKYASDSSTYKYVIEIDSATKNFSNPQRVTVTGATSKVFTAKELNTILLNNNYAFNVPVDLEMRLISSYGNNNERYTSNVVKLRATPYKVPPKVALPTSGKLFIVGNATAGGDATGWNNPVPVPSQEFARLDETTWAGVFQLNGGKEYLILPVNGDWSHKYALANNGVAGISAGGDFGYDLSDNFKSPATSGTYKIVVDFQSGKFTVTPYASTLPTDLFIVGDATAWGWNNPVPVPLQKFTRVNSSVWELTIPLVGGKEFLVLPENGNWGKKYAVKDNSVAGIQSGGEFGYHQDGQPAPDIFNSNFKAPATSGTYKITLNFAAPTTTAGAAGRFTIQ